MTPDDSPDAWAGLRWLRLLVTILTLTMIAAGLILIYLFVTRLPARDATPLVVPDSLEVAEGARVEAVTQGAGWWALVVTEADGTQVIQLHGGDGTLRQRVPVTPRVAD